MATKAEIYKQIADHTTEGLTAKITDWTRFLLMAGQFYKYNFLDQVMIYTQRPNATACAEFDLWNQRMNRHIRRGSKGIVLLYTRNGRLGVRHVFDISDTEPRAGSRNPLIWQYSDEYESAVTARLEECFHVPGGDNLAKQLIGLAVRFADEHWYDFKDRIMASVHDSRLDELDEDGVALQFRNAVTVSLSFLLLARCGFDLDTYFTPEDFACIGEFDTKDTVLVLGNAVSESANVILRQVEYAIKRHIRTPKEKSTSGNAAAGAGKPAAVPVSIPKPETPTAIPTEQLQEAPEQPAKEPTQTGAPLPGPLEAPQEPPAPAPAEPAPVAEPAPEQLELFAPPVPASRPAPVHVHPAPAAANFRIAEYNLGAGGPKAKYAMNVEAIRLLKRLGSEHRSATAAEQETLSRYVGWGGVPEAFDPDKAEWANEYRELKALLSEDEYASARASTLNAHFTMPVVIRVIYEALGSMGFISGNILDESVA